MDNRGNLYLDPSEQEIKEKELKMLNQEQYEKLSKLPQESRVEEYKNLEDDGDLGENRKKTIADNISNDLVQAFINNNKAPLFFPKGPSMTEEELESFRKKLKNKEFEKKKLKRKMAKKSRRINRKK